MKLQFAELLFDVLQYKGWSNKCNKQDRNCDDDAIPVLEGSSQSGILLMNLIQRTEKKC